MADIDWSAFADAVRSELDRAGLSTRAAAARWPGTNPAMWSRAGSGRKPLSAGSYMLVCRALDLDPWRFWLAETPAPAATSARRAGIRHILKRMRKQAVTAEVAHVTSRRAPAALPPAPPDGRATTPGAPSGAGGARHG